MAVRVNKSAFNIREKINELTKRFGLKGSELAAANTTQEARDLVSAGRKNIVINGDMRIAQRGTSSSNIIGGGVTTCDRWVIRNTGYTTLAGSSSQDPESPPGFNYSLKLDITTPETLDIGDVASIRYYFEDRDWQPSAYGTSQAKSVTLSFWIRSSVAGTYTINLYNNAGGGARSITLPYTINSADTWEYKSIIVPPDTDSTASFSGDNTRGMEIAWIFSAGSTYTGGDHTGWVTYTNDKFANGQTADLAGVVSNLYLTGVQVELGKNATEFEHRFYGEELALCQRYCYVVEDSYFLMKGYNVNSGENEASLSFPTTMRAVPATPSTNPATGVNQVAGSWNSITPDAAVAAGSQSGSGTGLASLQVIAGTIFDAEL